MAWWVYIIVWLVSFIIPVMVEFSFVLLLGRPSDESMASREILILLCIFATLNCIFFAIYQVIKKIDYKKTKDI